MSENQEVTTQNAEETNLYTKIKDYNAVTDWTLSTAESAANKAMEIGKPLIEAPIKKVDEIFSSGLDYIKTNAPEVKPSGEIYSNTKDSVENAFSKVQPAAADALQSAKTQAKTLTEPAVEKAKELKDSGTEKAKELKDSGTQKVKDMLPKAD